MAKDILAKMRVGSKHFEVVVELDSAVKIRKTGAGNVAGALLSDKIYTNVKDGSAASKADLIAAFQTDDLFAIAEKIIKKGELQLPKDYRDEEREAKKRKIIDWYIRNAVDAKTGRPFAPDMISSALDKIGLNVDNSPVEQQIAGINEAIRKILPIKIETKKLIITVPAVYTGKIYGLLNEYKEKEDWLSNGDLKMAVSIPIGLQSEFYDKLNAVTHGAALSEEVKEKAK